MLSDDLSMTEASYGLWNDPLGCGVSWQARVFHQRAGRSETLGQAGGACLYHAILRALVSFTPLSHPPAHAQAALIVSAFSNWSRYGHHAQTTVTSPRTSCSLAPGFTRSST